MKNVIEFENGNKLVVSPSKERVIGYSTEFLEVFL